MSMPGAGEGMRVRLPVLRILRLQSAICGIQIIRYLEMQRKYSYLV